MFGILMPEQVALAQRIFRNIVEEPWFARSYENERDFAMVIVHLLQNATANEAELAYSAKAIARERFSKEKPTDMGPHR